MAAKPKLRKAPSLRKTARRRGGSARGKQDAAGPEVGPEHRDGKDAYGKYLDQLTREAPPLLTPKQELEIGREMDDHVCKAVENMLADVVEAGAILQRSPEENLAQDLKEGGALLEGCADDRILRWRAARCLERLNPDRLSGERLEAQLRRRMRGSEADDLFKIYAEKEGLATRDRFIRSNLRLVIMFARKQDPGGLTVGEIVQEGNIGLIHAVMIYDYRRGWRFSTMAGWWIRHEIGRAVADKARGIRLPVHMNEFVVKIYKLRQALALRLGRDPEDEEVVKALRAQDVRDKKKPTSAQALLKKVQSLERNPRYPISFDQPARTDEGDGDTMLDQFSPEPEDEASRWAPIRDGSAVRRLQTALARLSPIESDVLSLRFGLADDEARTFADIGLKHELSRERIRQIQNAALEKLRKDKVIRPLLRELRQQAA